MTKRCSINSIKLLCYSAWLTSKLVYLSIQALLDALTEVSKDTATKETIFKGQKVPFGKVPSQLFVVITLTLTSPATLTITIVLSI